MEKRHLPDFQSSQERTDYIKNNADYFTISFRMGMRNNTFEFEDLDTARMNAVLSAMTLKQPVMIYAVIYPYDTWIESVKPTQDQINEYLPRIVKCLTSMRIRLPVK